MKRILASVGAALLVAWSASPGLGADAQTKATARDVLKKYQDAVVTVKLVVKARVIRQGKELAKQESQVEIAGTVLTPNGLTVVSNGSSNPFSLFGDEDAGDANKTETETTDVKLLLRDGKEIPARFVLRDKDLDLAFLMPRDKDVKLTHVALEKAKAPELLDDLIFLYRLGKSMNREPGLSLGRVEAVVKKPRTFVVPDEGGSGQSLGCPVFDASGRAIGVAVMRRAPSSGGAGGFSELLSMLRPIILTSEDVLQVAEQAMQEKEEAK